MSVSVRLGILFATFLLVGATGAYGPEAPARPTIAMVVLGLPLVDLSVLLALAGAGRLLGMRIARLQWLGGPPVRQWRIGRREPGLTVGIGRLPEEFEFDGAFADARRIGPRVALTLVAPLVLLVTEVVVLAWAARRYGWVGGVVIAATLRIASFYLTGRGPGRTLWRMATGHRRESLGMVEVPAVATGLRALGSGDWAAAEERASALVRETPDAAAELPSSARFLGIMRARAGRPGEAVELLRPWLAYDQLSEIDAAVFAADTAWYLTLDFLGTDHSGGSGGDSGGDSGGGSGGVPDEIGQWIAFGLGGYARPARLLLARAVATARSGRPGPALRYAETGSAVARPWERADAHQAYALVHAIAGDHESAARHADAARRLDPTRTWRPPLPDARTGS